MIRLLDISIALISLVILSPLLILILILVWFDVRAPLFFQKRVGRNQKTFTLIKFRTMPIKTKSVGTHLIKDMKLTLFGYFLRRTKLDEIPQLFNVLFNSMTLVGPRPCLLNQKKLIKERKKRGVFKAKPGITGLAQISNINMKTPILLAKTDLKMLKEMTLLNYFYYISRTILKIF